MLLYWCIDIMSWTYCIYWMVGLPLVDVVSVMVWGVLSQGGYRVVARRRYGTPWWWHGNVETCRTINYIKRHHCNVYFCDINLLKPTGYVMYQQFNLLKSTGYVMHQQFNIQQLYALPTLYLCVFCIYLRTNTDLCHLQHKLIGL